MFCLSINFRPDASVSGLNMTAHVRYAISVRTQTTPTERDPFFPRLARDLARSCTVVPLVPLFVSFAPARHHKFSSSSRIWHVTLALYMRCLRCGYRDIVSCFGLHVLDAAVRHTVRRRFALKCMSTVPVAPAAHQARHNEWVGVRVTLQDRNGVCTASRALTRTPSSHPCCQCLMLACLS